MAGSDCLRMKGFVVKVLKVSCAGVGVDELRRSEEEEEDEFPFVRPGDTR